MVGKKKGAQGGKKSAPSSKKSKKSAKPSTSATTKPDNQEVDTCMLNQHAMRNLYYTAHGAPEALQLRGFGWQGASGKKGGGKKGKGKKKKK